MKTIIDKIESILFQIGKEIKIHKIDNNIILDIDYQKYINEILSVFEEYKNE